MVSGYELHHGDCLAIMPTLAAGSVDLILADLPYGTTACAWDSVIPLAPLWAEYRRVLKPRGAVVLFGAQPFTSALVMSNLEWFKYCWYWKKTRPTGFQNAKLQPLRAVEEVAVFGGPRITYHPQGVRYVGRAMRNSRSTGGGVVRGSITATAGRGSLRTAGREYIQEYTNYPENVLRFALDATLLHPTQKPVALLEYLVRTYTNEGDTVLDNTMGSGSTGVACARAGRRFVGIELYPLLDRPIHPETNPDHFGTAARCIADAARELRGEFRPRHGEGEPLHELPLFAEANP